MDGSERKAARAAYKERKQSAGIYAVRCKASGQAWIGATPNLDSIRNRIWFTLRVGSNLNSELQRAWKSHGSDGFGFEILERFEDDETDYVRDALLKERAAHWRTELSGSAVAF